MNEQKLWAWYKVWLTVVVLVTAYCLIDTHPTYGASGYDPRDRGLSQSCVRFNAVNAPLTCRPIDFAAEDYFIHPYLSPQYISLYAQRYGDCILVGCSDRVFKRWLGPGNEVKGTLVETLKWGCRTGVLNPAKATPDCLPTDREVTDMQATGDRLWAEYLKAEVQGFRADNREVIRDAEKVSGLGQGPHPFWGITWYWENQIGAVPGPTPVDPPVVEPPAIDPPPTVCPDCPVLTPCGIQCPASSLLGLARAVKQRCGSGVGRSCDWRIVKLAEDVVKGLEVGCGVR